MHIIPTDTQKAITKEWFLTLRNSICQEFEAIEEEFAAYKACKPAKFTRQDWQRDGGGGGTMSIMRGNVFEKVGVNISTVHGQFSAEFRDKIPGTKDDPNFYATGISLVAHMCSPLVPAVHFNTRYIATSKAWFGGGGDLTPTYPNNEDTHSFHTAFEQACNKHDASYYPLFKKQCDEYFYLRHRKEPRGIGGIFYDYLSEDFDKNFAFTKDVGLSLLDIYPKIARKNMLLPWSAEQREQQLIKRGRYVEFNLLYDRGTSFGLATGGNVEAILMSLPPEVKWP